MKNWDTQSALEHLKHQESFQFLMGDLEAMLGEALDDLETMPADQLERAVGKALAIRQLLESFTQM